ncbi:ATP-grasp domain-containing protein [Deinococcus sp.]|uniref:ATP-grasp domain-containing protein n=1 Tax=Deinococcus sp. TaxID=47478 RepID=UPI003CC56AE8
MLLFPAQPFAGRVPDDAYAGELALAQSMKLDAALIDLEALLEGQMSRALRWVPHADAPRPALYRGWMLRPEVYEALHTALSERGWHLLNSPAQYRHTHYLPESFEIISEVSPRTVWIPAASAADIDWDAVRTALKTFGAAPIIVKDYVKSRKHEWNEACFIPDASDSAQALGVIQTLVTRQGGEFQGGLVLRAFEEFAALTRHSGSGMPLTREYRLFWLDGQLVSASRYWEEGEYPSGEVPPAPFAQIGRNVQSRFFTMDVAQRTDGVWRVVELGDGGVAGLPERADAAQLYEALARALGNIAHG